MGRNLIKDCLRQLSLVGVEVDERAVQITAREFLGSGIKSLILLLDGQENTWQPGRLACLKLNADFQVMHLTVLEQFEDFGVRLLMESSTEKTDTNS